MAMTCYGTGAVGLVAFLLAERRLGEDAVLPLRLFANGVFRLTTAVAVVVGVGLFGGVALLPLYLQVVTGSTPTETGLRMIPMVAGILLASIVSGRITTRTGRYKIFPVLGLGLASAGMLLFHALTRAAATPELRAALADPVTRANPADAPAFDPGSGIPAVVRDSSSIQHMDGRLAQPFLAGYSASLDLAFLVGAGVLAAGFVLIWFLREIPLRTESGIDAQRAEAAAARDEPPLTGPPR